MDKVKRIRTAVEGGYCDTLPYAFWTHLPGVDTDPVKLAQTTYEFFNSYDLDFIKTMNNGMYAIEDYGCEIDFSPIEAGGVAKLVSTPVTTSASLKELPEAVTSKGAFARELKSLGMLADLVKGKAPISFTIFSPLTTLQKMCGGEKFERFLKEDPESVHFALERIAASTASLASKALEEGADGVFLATQMSSYDKMSEEDYATFGKPYDITALKGASKGWFNIIHAHGDNIMFRLLKDYPVQVFNWHAWETLPELTEARELSGKCLMGGIKRMDITDRNLNGLQNQIYNSIKLLNKTGHILTPGCVIRYPLDDKTLRFIRTTKEWIENTLAKERNV